MNLLVCCFKYVCYLKLKLVNSTLSITKAGSREHNNELLSSIKGMKLFE
jgi:hypothetical protein